MRYFHLITRSMVDADPEKEWYEKAKNSWSCSKCHSLIKPGPIDVVVDPKPINIPLNIVGGVIIGYARKDLVEMLGEDAREYFWWGKVYGVGGKEYSDFLTFRGKKLLNIRGNQESTYWRCEVCGSHMYFPMGTRYLLSSDLTGDPIYESQFHQIIINEDLYNKIKGIKWKKLGIDELKVLDKPVDGITFSD